MKKLILFSALIFSLAVFSCNDTRGQTTQPYGPLTITGATLTNTDTAYATTPAIYGSGSVAITTTVTRVSGTATGSTFLYASNDYVNWELVSATDSVNIASPITYGGITQKTYTFKVPINYWIYYQTRTIQGGTAVNTQSGDYKFSKDNGYR